MSFFGLFKPKPKPSKEINQIFKKVFSRMFPGGPEQLDREIDKLNNLVGGKYENELLREAYLHMAGLYAIAEDRSDERIVKSVSIKCDGKIADEDTLLIYEYLKKKLLMQQFGDDQSVIDEFYSGLYGGNEGCDTDEIPGSYGSFGYVPTNPIPTKGIVGSHAYLSKLKLAENDDRISWERTDTCSAENIENIIDKYKLSKESGEYIATIYISPYHKRNSEKTPTDFVLSY